jgi:hypothetical protein
MRWLIDAARLENEAPVPDIFPLSSWGKERKPILEWLADQIRARHGRPLSEARSLIWHHQVVPVLDGLDEVAPEHRGDCVEAINRFWKEHRGGPLVVCSRHAEYEALPERVKLGGAVTVCPPEPDEIDRYLAAAGARWEGVRVRLRDRTEHGLQELLSTPLMLSVAVLAYSRADSIEMATMELPPGDRGPLWSRYVETVTSRDYAPLTTEPQDASRYSEAQVRHWLGWLAKEMASRNETELWLHEWSGPVYWQNGIKTALGLIVALCFALAYGLDYGYVRARGLTYGLESGLLVGMGVIVAVGLTFGLNVGLAPMHRKVFDRSALALGFALGMVAALVVALMRGPPSELPPHQVAYGLAYGLAFALMGSRSFGTHFRSAPHRRKPFDLGALTLGLALGLVVALVVRLTNGLAVRSAVGLALGLAYGLAFLVDVGPGPTYRRPLDRRALVVGLAVGMAMGVAVGMAVGLSLGLAAGLGFGLVTGPAFGMVGALAFGLLEEGPERERIVASSPRQVIMSSAWSGLAFGLIVVVVVGLALGLTGDVTYGLAGGLIYGLAYGPAIGLAAGLTFGLDAIVFHYAFCLWLRKNHLGPWHWPGFLEWAHDRLLLRTNGASYQWIHLELRNYLAQHHVEEGRSVGRRDGRESEFILEESPSSPDGR